MKRYLNYVIPLAGLSVILILSRLLDLLMIRIALKKYIKEELAKNDFMLLKTGYVHLLSKGDFGKVTWRDFSFLYPGGAANHSYNTFLPCLANAAPIFTTDVVLPTLPL